MAGYIERGLSRNYRFIRGITQDEYDKKAYELKERQYELNDKLKKMIEADEI